MQKDIVQTPNAPAPVGPYSQGVKASGTFLFASGQIALDPATGDLIGGDNVTLQTEQVMQNLGEVLREAGAGWENVVKTTVFLADMNDFATVNNVYAKFFADETAPARACVEVARLPKDVKVEIDCIALV